jgi:hypothetical protein
LTVLAWIRLRNGLRRRLRQGFAGRILSLVRPALGPLRLHVAVATRMSESQFWADSATGQSLLPWLTDPRITAKVYAENTRALPELYNEQIIQAEPGVALVLMHDDVWLIDEDWPEKVRYALSKYDIVGVAGTTRRSKNQPAWLFRERTATGFVWDRGFLSGAVMHGPDPGGEITMFGPSPARCVLLDGVFLAVRPELLRESRALFDPRFKFHFYDLDFCRTAERCGLSMGTWPIDLTHQSGGSFGASWLAALDTYLQKWKG